MPRFYLRGFADESETLERFDLESRESVPLSVNNAGVVKDFYTVTLPDGSKSDLFERAFSEVEGDAAEAVRELKEGRWPLTGDARAALSSWVALQHLRGVDQRLNQNRLRAGMIRLIVGASGKEALREHIQSALGRPIDEDELDREWADLTKPGGPDLTPDVHQHIDTILSLVDGTAAYFCDCHWTLTRFQRRALLTSDRPVSLVAAPDHPPWSGVGIFTAGLVAVPISRRVAMTIQPRWRLETYTEEPDSVPDFEAPGTTKMALSINQETAIRARRFIYHHPDDSPLDRITLRDADSSILMDMSDTEHFISEEGLFRERATSSGEAVEADSTPEGDHPQPSDFSSISDGDSFSLEDLPWPIPGRRSPRADGDGE